MRTLIVIAVLAAASPAAAQSNAALQQQLYDLQMQQEQMRQRTIALENALMAQEARLRAEQGIAASRAQSARPYIPLRPTDVPSAALAPVDTSKLVSIPDDRLAASTAAVREATRPRR